MPRYAHARVPPRRFLNSSDAWSSVERVPDAWRRAFGLT
jgi:hypothetical protein